eukprot:773023-Prorocentrum_minimum.AAC.3
MVTADTPTTVSSPNPNQIGGYPPEANGTNISKLALGVHRHRGEGVVGEQVLRVEVRLHRGEGVRRLKGHLRLRVHPRVAARHGEVVLTRLLRGGGGEDHLVVRAGHALKGGRDVAHLEGEPATLGKRRKGKRLSARERGERKKRSETRRYQRRQHPGRFVPGASSARVARVPRTSQSPGTTKRRCDTPRDRRRTVRVSLLGPPTESSARVFSARGADFPEGRGAEGGSGPHQLDLAKLAPCTCTFCPPEAPPPGPNTGAALSTSGGVHGTDEATNPAPRSTPELATEYVRFPSNRNLATSAVDGITGRPPGEVVGADGEAARGGRVGAGREVLELVVVDVQEPLALLAHRQGDQVPLVPGGRRARRLRLGRGVQDVVVVVEETHPVVHQVGHVAAVRRLEREHRLRGGVLALHHGPALGAPLRVHLRLRGRRGEQLAAGGGIGGAALARGGGHDPELQGVAVERAEGAGERVGSDGAVAQRHAHVLELKRHRVQRLLVRRREHRHLGELDERRVAHDARVVHKGAGRRRVRALVRLVHVRGGERDVLREREARERRLPDGARERLGHALGEGGALLGGDVAEAALQEGGRRKVEAAKRERVPAGEPGGHHVEVLRGHLDAVDGVERGGLPGGRHRDVLEGNEARRDQRVLGREELVLELHGELVVRKDAGGVALEHGGDDGGVVEHREIPDLELIDRPAQRLALLVVADREGAHDWGEGHERDGIHHLDAVHPQRDRAARVGGVGGEGDMVPHVGDHRGVCGPLIVLVQRDPWCGVLVVDAREPCEAQARGHLENRLRFEKA